MENLTSYFLYPYFDSFYNKYWIPRFSITSLETIKKYIFITHHNSLGGEPFLHATFGGFPGAEPFFWLL